jgi:hypothetical protein
MLAPGLPVNERPSLARFVALTLSRTVICRADGTSSVSGPDSSHACAKMRQVAFRPTLHADCEGPPEVGGCINIAAPSPRPTSRRPRAPPPDRRLLRPARPKATPAPASTTTRATATGAGRTHPRPAPRSRRSPNSRSRGPLRWPSTTATRSATPGSTPTAKAATPATTSSRQRLADLVTQAGTHSCVVLRGAYAEPYTGITIAFVRDDGFLLDFDHVVALGNAWSDGAARWESPQARRVRQRPARRLGEPRQVRRGRRHVAPLAQGVPLCLPRRGHGQVARFRPTDPLAAEQEYTVTLNPEFSLAVTDVAGNPVSRREELYVSTASPG